MKTELHDILFVDDKFIRNRFRDDFFKKFHPFLYEKIWDSISGRYSFKEKIYIIFHEIDNPVCKVCGNETSLISFNKGFHNYCSKQCIQKDNDVKEKVRQTNLKKYGVDNPNKSKEFRKKTEQTNLEKYGTENPFQSEEIKDKIKRTNLEKYGTENPFQSEEIKDKIKQTNLEKYGVEHNSECKLVVEKRKKRFLEIYGVDKPNKCSDIIKKRNETNIKNYLKKYSEILGVGNDDMEVCSGGDVCIRNYCSNHKTFKIGRQNLFNRIR